MLSPSEKSTLPVPFLPDSMFEFTRRQPHSFRTRPPKLQPKYDAHISLNRTSNNSLCAHAISFKDNSFGSGIDNDKSCNQLLSPMYNKDSNESYFEQCFEIIAKIGEGSFGEVFKVRSKEDGLLYAVKKSKKLFRSESYRRERLEEVRRYEQFSEHEHCVKLYKAWEQNDRLYMQMELCRENLENYLSRTGQIPETRVWSILLDLLLALRSLHNRNLIHLDIKLDNILIGEDGSCKLGDFGLVVDVLRANINSPTEGDNRYIASELMEGKFSKAADIFSLGITILELSCNLELPPNGPLWQELRSGILPSKFIMQISPELQNIIKWMMHPDPNKRPTVEQLLSHEKLVTLLEERKRRNVCKTITNYYRRASRFLLTKMCNIKNLLKYYILAFISIFKFNREKITITVDVENDDDDDNNELLNKSNHLNNNQSDIQYHSTPLNYSFTNFRRSKMYSARRKCPNSDELNSNGFDFESDDNIEFEVPSVSNILCKQLFTSEDSD